MFRRGGLVHDYPLSAEKRSCPASRAAAAPGPVQAGLDGGLGRAQAGGQLAIGAILGIFPEQDFLVRPGELGQGLAHEPRTFLGEQPGQRVRIMRDEVAVGGFLRIPIDEPLATSPTATVQERLPDGEPVQPRGQLGGLRQRFAPGDCRQGHFLHHLIHGLLNRTAADPAAHHARSQRPWAVQAADQSVGARPRSGAGSVAVMAREFLPQRAGSCRGWQNNVLCVFRMTPLSGLRIPDSRFRIPDSKSPSRLPMLGDLESGIWNLESGIWNLESGIRLSRLIRDRQLRRRLRPCRVGS